MARIRRWQRWLIVGIAVVAALAVAGPFVYIHFIEGKAPKRLSLSSTRGTATTVASGAAADIPLDGTWKVASGSQAGYRVKEILFGQNHEAVGRTSAVTGDAAIDTMQYAVVICTVP